MRILCTYTTCGAGIKALWSVERTFLLRQSAQRGSWSQKPLRQSAMGLVPAGQDPMPRINRNQKPEECASLPPSAVGIAYLERGQGSPTVRKRQKEEKPVSAHDASDEPTRRDFLYIATGMAGVVGAGALPAILSTRCAPTLRRSPCPRLKSTWHRSNPAPRWWSNSAASRVDPQPHAGGNSGREGRPARRAEGPGCAQCQSAGGRDGDRRGPRRQQGKRKHPGHDSRLHPFGLHSAWPAGRFRRLVLPCHGSHYDTAGRIRKGPAPENLPIPPVAFLTDTKIKIG